MISHRTAGKFISFGYRILESSAVVALVLQLLTDETGKATIFGVLAVYFHLCASQIERGERKQEGK